MRMETMESPFFAPQRPHIETPHCKKRRGVFVASVVIHAVLIVILATAEKNRTIPAPELPPPINARLVFKAPTPAVTSKENLPHPAITSPPATQPVEEPSPQIEKVDIEPVEPAPAEKVSQAPAQNPVSTTKDTAPAASSAPAPVESEKGSRPATSLTSRRALDAFFSQQQAQARQRDAEMAAKAYRKQKTSPDIVDPRKDKLEEEVNAPPTVNVNCSDTTTNVLATIATFTGGRVACSNRSNGFDKSIDKHLNKGVKDDENR